MMKHYSHARINENLEKEGSQELKAHLQSVTHIALQNVHANANFYLDHKQIRHLIQDICLFHDLGKYTTYFQNYLLDRQKVSNDLKKHSRLGAYFLANKYFHEDFNLALISYFCVMNHHGNLDYIRNLEFFGETGKEKYKKRFLQQKSDLEQKIDQIEKELSITDLQRFLYFPDYSSFRKHIKRKLKNRFTIQNYFLINYIFSLLSEADKIDASNTPVYEKRPINEKAVEAIIPLKNLSDFPALENIHGQNELRNLARSTVVHHIHDKDILDYRLFTLTAPTGIGKTLTSLDFALKLKKLLRARQNQEAQIIYGLPFINIIEQAYDVYANQVFHKEIANDDIRILAHYQYADVFGKEKTNEQTGYHQKLMQWDTWQSDLVITSFVQFFETLITNKNKLLKKFHHYAGSIIILDEVQTLRLDLMPLIGAVLYYLSKILDARIILMTATQPKIFDLAQRIILNKEGAKLQIKELLNNHDEIFEKFRRTMIIPLLDQDIDEEGFYQIFLTYWNDRQSCLIVCNTVQRSLKVYEALSQMNFKNSVYYLSTNIVPAQRNQVVQSIQKDLKEGNRPVLVTTQVVEAGVDLDFDMGFRDIGPVDSIVQVAGRINRENSSEKQNAPLYVVKFIDDKNVFDCAKVYGDVTFHQAINALEGHNEISEKDFKKLVEAYFSNLSEKTNFDLSCNIFQSMKILRYDGEKEDYPISYFRIIKQAPWVISVFVETDEKAIEARKAFQSLLDQEISKETFDRKYKLDFHQHIIAVPEYLPKMQDLKADGNSYLTEDILLIRNELLENYYSFITGFSREEMIEDETVDML